MGTSASDRMPRAARFRRSGDPGILLVEVEVLEGPGLRPRLGPAPFVAVTGAGASGVKLKDIAPVGPHKLADGGQRRIDALINGIRVKAQQLRGQAEEDAFKPHEVEEVIL